MAKDIENNIFPIMYDIDMAVGDLYDLIVYDSTISEQKREKIYEKYPYSKDNEKSEFISRLICFSMERNFVKRDTKTQNLLSARKLSPIVSYYIYDGFVPKPCKYFCGRDFELQTLHSMLEDNNKIFIQGVVGIGKSEFVKKYAAEYRKEYTNILYFNYSGDLKQIIADCDFSDDNIEENEDIRFKRHNRFLRSLKEDSLIIIDNFNTASSKDSLFSIIMKYRCKIIFTTRSRFDNYMCYDLKEISDIDILVNFVEYFYKKISENTDIVKQIIEEVHRHTFSVELAARLLASGISEPEELLKKLKETKSVLKTNDKINITKDGINSKATYYDHIHTLLSMSSLSEEAKNIMRNMTLIPYEGINLRLFAQWTALKNLNTVNDLIEYGFIQADDYRNIMLYPLIQEIAIDDTKPSITNCDIMIENIRNLCLFHGTDLPYHKLLFKTAENVVNIAEHNDIERYKLFLKDIFPYMEKYFYGYGMRIIISELQNLSTDKTDKALLLDYKAAYENIFDNHKKALQYEIQAAKLCDDIVSLNPHLVSNIYGNLGTLYYTKGQSEKTKWYVELAYNILINAKLDYTNDNVIQMCNYANLSADMGEPLKAVKILKRCMKIVKEYNSEYSSDYANILWSTGYAYLQMGDKISAGSYFNKAINIYSIVWESEPELIQAKVNELQEVEQITAAIAVTAI